MRVRIGYVAIALNLPKITSSSSVTFKTYSKLCSKQERLDKLKKVTLSNMNDLYKILQYNIENEIHFYRITSKLVPLATHPEVDDWNYRNIFKRDFEIIGELIRKYNLRVDTHPDQFNVINSTREEVVKSTERNLWFHVNLFNDINYKLGKMIIHVGGSQGGKDKAIDRFINNFRKFPQEIREKLILENDDKVFKVKDVLGICKELNIPMVLDAHHHICNNNGELLENMLEGIFNTWSEEMMPPKVHFSSPRDGEKDRKHSDYINAYDFIEFIEKCKDVNKDLDVMLEAKKKDLALYKLIDDIKNIKKEWKWIDKTTFEI
ncbi:UV DNA damage repair endonuclease UvsE [Clostridium aestuarii]|uniref:UV DNA damage repair endonuclease UvsE n=1 Tax=Clostridium aestuarii TaxID=338193 RepID=A0ABT4D0U3_9CLOT|nr:UV DNA damage repair endonuclease UvsE [Clostridium aestuarii]MCY6484861.1 UV DNA damage repair endonuclease UvsE [Clostridium aestuarii]